MANLTTASTTCHQISIFGERRWVIETSLPGRTVSRLAGIQQPTKADIREAHMAAKTYKRPNNFVAA